MSLSLARKTVLFQVYLNVAFHLGIGKGQWTKKQERKDHDLKKEGKIIKAQKRRLNQKGKPLLFIIFLVLLNMRDVNHVVSKFEYSVFSMIEPILH